MKTASIFLFISLIAFIALFFSFGLISKTGAASGLVGGMLSKCSDKPNCVCSEYKEDANHYIDPIILPQNITFDTFPLLKDVIQDMGGKVQVESNNYLAAIFTSSLFKFVDDLEIRSDPTKKIIHIRSASRVGYNDMGINKKRTELLKKLFYIKVLAAKKSRPLTHETR
ncbi:MAG: DUF1499 domain-containing protein [Gallionella sp.]